MNHPFKRCRKTPPTVRPTNKNKKITKLLPITENQVFKLSKQSKVCC